MSCILVLFILVQAILDLRDFEPKNRKFLDCFSCRNIPQNKTFCAIQSKSEQKRDPMNYENPLNRGLPVSLTSNSLERARLVTALKVGKWVFPQCLNLDILRPNSSFVIIFIWFNYVIDLIKLASKYTMSFSDFNDAKAYVSIYEDIFKDLYENI